MVHGSVPCKPLFSLVVTVLKCLISFKLECRPRFITSVSTVSILGRDKGYMVKYTPSPEYTKDCGQLHFFGTCRQKFLRVFRVHVVGFFLLSRIQNHLF